MVVSVVAGKQMNEAMMTLVRNIMVAGVKSLNAGGIDYTILTLVSEKLYVNIGRRGAAAWCKSWEAVVSWSRSRQWCCCWCEGLLLLVVVI